MSDKAYSPPNLRLTVYCAAFTALFIVGGYTAIPIGPVPIVLVDFFVMLAGLFLGWKMGLSSVGLYLFLGFLGLPVFSQGRAGLVILLSPSGGFLIGYLLLVLAIGLIAGSGKVSWQRLVTALIVGNILLYAAGVPYLKMLLELDWNQALAVGLLPFLPGTIIKSIAVVGIAKTLLPRFRQGMLGDS